ncbi:MAG: hypothetical protein B6U85_08010 [Desulfurococcales archaeon ex4484_42]|nr:MAG: hypothetical protein B6U85_08010 [Desulfurococcales archaeon ex4484_42]
MGIVLGIKIITYIAIPTVLVTLTYNALVRYVIRFEYSKGLTGIDIHKPSKPKIPSTSGPILIPTLLVTIITLYVIYKITGGYELMVLAIYLVPSLISGLIGLVDDLVTLDAKTKTFAYSVGTNGLNMIDTHNGIVPSVTLIAASFSLPLIARNVVTGKTSVAALYLAVVVIVIALNQLIYNMYPARIFNGDSGSFILGALLVSLTILGRVEFFMITALMPLIINGFQIITSIGGLRERREIVKRPTVIKGKYIEGSCDLKAPITLVQLITLKNPLTECELVITEILLFILTGFLALITMLLTS